MFSVILAIVVVLGAVLALRAWFLSDELRRRALTPDANPRQADIEVVDIQENQVTLRLAPGSKRKGLLAIDGVWGMEWSGGYAQVGEIFDVDDQRVVREFRPLIERPQVGELVLLDIFAYPGDPQQALGIPFEEVSYNSQLGEFAAWFVDGPSDTWVILIHGSNSSPREALRVLPTVAELGLPSLVITYRNDKGAPANPDGFQRYGQTEWQDLEGAAAYAIEHGAKKLILVGYSMGGAIVMSFLYRSELADKVMGAILECPMLDLNATVDLGGRSRWHVRLLLPFVKLIGGLRFGINWKELNYLTRAHQLTTPILLFHGDQDNAVPVETSDRLAKARPDIVEYRRVAGGTHAASWNIRPSAFEAAVRGFLEKLTR